MALGQQPASAWRAWAFVTFWMDLKSAWVSPFLESWCYFSVYGKLKRNKAWLTTPRQIYVRGSQRLAKPTWCTDFSTCFPFTISSFYPYFLFSPPLAGQNARPRAAYAYICRISPEALSGTTQVHMHALRWHFCLGWPRNKRSSGVYSTRSKNQKMTELFFEKYFLPRLLTFLDRVLWSQKIHINSIPSWQGNVHFIS